MTQKYRDLWVLRFADGGRVRLDSARGFQTMRRQVRTRLATTDIGAEIEDLVSQLLAGAP